MSDRLQTALNSLPHGPEFRFLDRLTALEPGISACGEYTVKTDEFFLRDHFPNGPLMTGVQTIDIVAQLMDVVAQSGPKIGPLQNVRLTASSHEKILGSS